MKRLQIAGLIISITGVILLGYVPGENEINNVNRVWMHIALLLWMGCGSCYLRIWNEEPRCQDEHALQLRQLTSAVFYGVMILNVFGGWELVRDVIPTTAFPIIAVSALFGTASNLCYYRAIVSIGAAKARALNITCSAWSILFSLFLLGTMPGLEERCAHGCHSWRLCAGGNGSERTDRPMKETKPAPAFLRVHLSSKSRHRKAI